jgi:hypothetical protein
LKLWSVRGKGALHGPLIVGAQHGRMMLARLPIGR